MPATPSQTLLNEGSCFICFGAGPMSEILILALLDQIAQNINPPPPDLDNFRIWDNGSNIRISNIGDSRIWQ